MQAENVIKYAYCLYVCMYIYVCHIILLVPQTGPPIIKFRKRMPFVIGEKLFALCNTTRAFPAPHITWLINGKKVSRHFIKRFFIFFFWLLLILVMLIGLLFGRYISVKNIAIIIDDSLVKSNFHRFGLPKH